MPDIVTLRPYQDYYNGYDDNEGFHKSGYVELVKQIEINIDYILLLVKKKEMSFLVTKNISFKIFAI